MAAAVILFQAHVVEQDSIKRGLRCCARDGDLRLLGEAVARSINCNHEDVAVASISVGGPLDGQSQRRREVTLYFLENY